MREKEEKILLLIASSKTKKRKENDEIWGVAENFAAETRTITFYFFFGMLYVIVMLKGKADAEKRQRMRGYIATAELQHLGNTRANNLYLNGWTTAAAAKKEKENRAMIYGQRWFMGV